MTAQVSTSVPADSLLYSFTPASVGRGGGPVPAAAAPAPSVTPPPLGPMRRVRAQSVPGEPTHRAECEEVHMDPPGSPLRGSTAAAATATAGNGGAVAASSNGAPAGSAVGPASGSTTTATGGGGSGGTTSGGASTLSSASLSVVKPLSAMCRCGSADRHHHGPSSSLGSLASLTALGGSGGGGPAAGLMPMIANCVVGGGSVAVAGNGIGGLPPMRHSVSGNPTGTGGGGGIGLPKLDLPAITFGGGSGGGTVAGSLDLPGLGPSGTGGRRSLSGGLGDIQTSTSAFLDVGPQMSAPPLPFEASPPPSPSRNAVLAPLRVSGTFAASANGIGGGGGGGGGGLGDSGGGWCSGVISASRRYASPGGLVDVTGMSLSAPGPLLPCASETAVATPLTPNLPASGAGAPPRRSHSLTARGSAGGGRRLLGDSAGADGSLMAAAGAAGGASPDGAVAAALAALPAAGSSGSSSGSPAVRAMSEINSDLQKATGALLALQAPACRPRSAGGAPEARAAGGVAAAAAAPPPPPPPQLTVAQLAALKESGPDLQWEVRVAVRRVFQVLRQELAAAAPGAAGRQLGSTVHECWATLDAYLEGTTELTCSLVDSALEARITPARAASLTPAPPPGQRQRPMSASNDGSGLAGSEAEREAERLRSSNEDLRRQLEETRARLARVEAEAASVSAAAAAAAAAAAVGGAAGGARGGGGGAAAAAGASPRPPPTLASPPLERCYSVSPRRGKHALVQSRDDPLATGGGGGGGDASEPSSPLAAAAAAGRDAELPRRFDRAAVLARGPSYDEVVIDGDDSDDSDVPDDIDARRHVLTYHSASFAEWVRGARRR